MNSFQTSRCIFRSCHNEAHRPTLLNWCNLRNHRTQHWEDIQISRSIKKYGCSLFQDSVIPEIFALWVKYSIPLRMNWSFPIMDQFLNPRVFTQIVLQWGNPSILMCFEESHNPKWRNIQIFYSNTTEGCKTCRLSPQVKMVKADESWLSPTTLN